MINYRIIARVFSQVLIIEGVFLLLTAAISWIYNEPAASAFLYSAIITLVTGILVFTPLRNEEKVYGTREGYVIITSVWLLFSIFGSLPYLFGSVTASFADAFFESVSGFTTTGATIFDEVESLPHGFLLWRSLTQWLGGIAIITIASHILPVVRSLNIQLPTGEFSGQVTDQIHPKAVETAKRLVFFYIGLTLGEALLLVIFKMPLFDAVCQSMSTLSTGGFSTRNDNIADFSSPAVRAVITLFMFFAGTNLSLLYFTFKGNFRKIIRNNEFVVYVIMVAGFSILISALLLKETEMPLMKALSSGFFNTTSIITTTGFYTEDFNRWSGITVLIIFILMFTGGMAGSASGGIKVIRLMITAINARNESRRLIHPDAYLPVRIDSKKVPQNIVYNLPLFIIIYLMILCAGAVLISFLDFDLITSFSTSASMLGNIGPGIGSFVPFSSYSAMPVMGKLILSALMLLGRLELLSVIILFSRIFYSK